MAQLIRMNGGSYLRICPSDPHYLEYGTSQSGWSKMSSELSWGEFYDLTTIDGTKVEAQTSRGVFISDSGGSSWRKKK